MYGAAEVSDELKEYVTKGPFMFPAVVPLSFCSKTKQQLFALPGGMKATEAWIKVHYPATMSKLDQTPRIIR